MIYLEDMKQLMDENLVAFLINKGVLAEFCDSVKNQFLRSKRNEHPDAIEDNYFIEDIYEDEHFQACTYTHANSITAAFNWGSSPYQLINWNSLHQEYARLYSSFSNKRSRDNKVPLSRLKKITEKIKKVEDMVLSNKEKEAIKQITTQLGVDRVMTIKEGLSYLLENFNNVTIPKHNSRKEYKVYFTNLYFNLIQAEHEVKN